jgi:HlyD family secretion protein
VVSEVNIVDGQECEEGTALISVDSTDDWSATVSVDELDINSIAVGQNVNVELDSLPNEVFEGVVTGISDYGSASGGITTYSVTVSVSDDDRFKINMTVNCEILAQEATDALLVPVDDVLTTGNASYVMVKVDRTEEEMAAIKQLILNKDYAALTEYMGGDAATLGVSMLADPAQLLYAEVRAVETGIENVYYTQITGGLAEGESVLAQESSDSSTEGGFMLQGMGEMVVGGGPDNAQGDGQIPQGGTFPGRN